MPAHTVQLRFVEQEANPTASNLFHKESTPELLQMPSLESLDRAANLCMAAEKAKLKPKVAMSRGAWSVKGRE